MILYFLRRKAGASVIIFEEKRQESLLDSECRPFQNGGLNHGDFRKHNLLLKFTEGCLRNVKLIDFQACWWSSPAFDLLVHLVFSVRPRVVDGHFETLVDRYMGYLKVALNDLDCSCDYEKDDFMRDVARLHSVVIACLLARCTFSYNVDHAKVAVTLIGQTQKEHSYEDCLADEAFADSVFERLQLCEKLGVFQTLETLSVDVVGAGPE